jgi:hypothetical protein
MRHPKNEPDRICRVNVQKFIVNEHVSRSELDDFAKAVWLTNGDCKKSKRSEQSLKKAGLAGGHGVCHFGVRQVSLTTAVADSF